MGTLQKVVIYADGCSRGNPGAAAIGGVIQDSSGSIVGSVSQAIGRATNNVAEYKSLIATLTLALDLGVSSVDVRMDSELVVKQVQGEYKTKNLGLKPLLKSVQNLLKEFDYYCIKHVPREQNKMADSLCNKALDNVKTRFV